MTAEIRPARPDEAGPALTATARRVGVNVAGGFVETGRHFSRATWGRPVFNSLPAFPSWQGWPDPIDTSPVSELDSSARIIDKKQA